MMKNPVNHGIFKARYYISGKNYPFMLFVCHQIFFLKKKFDINQITNSKISLQLKKYKPDLTFKCAQATHHEITAAPII